MSQLGRQWKDIDKRCKRNNPSVTSVGEVTSIQPFAILYNGIDISVANGDTIYINNLMLDDNIDLDVSSMDEAQNIKSMNPAPWISQGTSNSDYTAEISGTQKTFLTDLYNWIKSVHNRYIIHIGDKIAVQKLGNNTYIVLSKIQEVQNGQ